MKRSLTATLLAVLAVLLMAGVASAHAVVSPSQVPVDSYQRFTLRVPTEKPQPTVKVRMLLPAGLTFSGVQPVPGWTYAVEKDATNRVTAITWSGGEIGPNEFQEFGLQAKTPKDATKMAWKVDQTYKDGTVVSWNGAPGTETPASVTEVAAAAATAPAPSTPAPTTPAPSTPAPATPPPAPAPASGGFTPVAAYGGLGLGVIALIVALTKKK